MPSASGSTVFRPFTLKSLELKNRLAMIRTAPPDGLPGKANAACYRRRAKGQVGLILGEQGESRLHRTAAGALASFSGWSIRFSRSGS